MQFVREQGIRVRQVGMLILLALLTASAAWAGTPWADEPASLTISEFLNLQFRISMERSETDELNSYSLVTFYPSSDPQSALIFVVQTWHDERLATADLRREIRRVGDALTALFEAMARDPRISTRWKIANPKANIVVRHVRYSDLLETLAVTTGGETVFSGDEMAKAREAVTSRGAVWSW